MIPLEGPLRASVAGLLEVLRDALEGELVAVYVAGSVALDDFEPASSDLDVVVVAAAPLAAARKRALVDALLPRALVVPARGLELVVYTAEQARSPERGAFEINLNAGPRMPLHVTFDPAEEPAFWFVLDAAVLRARGLVVHGPPAAEVFAPVDRPRLLRALAASLEWHAAHAAREAGSPNSVLNACRAWRYAEEGAVSSKTEGALWVRARAPEHAALLDAALACRRSGDGARLDGEATLRFVSEIAGRIDAALERG